MGHRFEQRQEAELPASLEQVWAAITTGQGLDSWFMGHSEVRAGPGGTVRTTFGDYAPELSIAEWDPFRRFAYSSGEAQDGRCIAYEFLIEGRHGGSTVLRTVTSGFLPGDDWQDEYEAMTAGMQLYFRTLVEYLSYFAGRFATPITALGPAGTTWDRDRAALHRGLGLTEPVIRGDRVRVSPDGLAPIDGVVYFVNSDTIGVRSSDALYRFLRGFHKPVIASHLLFSGDADLGQAERAWQTWLSRLLG